VHDAIPFQFGPPRTGKPPRELLGELLLRQGNATEALAAFDRALQQAPNRALSLLGRARALKALGDAPGAADAYARLAVQWHRADADLAALSEVRAGAGDAGDAPASVGR
jgi:tetratricopeptide (TPR) repeat protein